MRDLFLEAGEEKRARSIEQDFIFTIDPDLDEEVARLVLNTHDNEFFYHKIVLRPTDRLKDIKATFASHKQLQAAYSRVRRYFDELRGQVGSGLSEALLQWRRYLLSGAKVLVLKVPDQRLAFVMFETLNDRGIKTSQADLVKNHLFEQSRKRLPEVERAWAAIRTVIESLGGEDELLLEYLRWSCCVLYGMTREKEVFDKIVEHSQGAVNAARVASILAEMANDYQALFNPSHRKWAAYPPQTRDAVKELRALDVKQMRPLLLSIAKNFTPPRLLVAYKRLGGWAVRLTIAGGTKAGRLDTFYATLAHQVNTADIRDYDALLAAAENKVPSDAAFQSYFETVRVKVSGTARYYLRALEKTERGEKEPAWVANEDPTSITLEHIMPQTVCSEWGTTQQDVETHAHRLGNLTLLQSSKNVLVDRWPFSKKKEVFAQSPYAFTRMLDQYQQWTIAQIEDRQRKLAALAPQTWPI